MSHPIETVNVADHRGATMNLLVGCKGHPCKRWCFAHPLAKRLKCPQCRTFEPHTHWERTPPPVRRDRYCYFQDMAEPNDFDEADIIRLKMIISHRPNDIWQILSHFGAFWQKYHLWCDNVWAMQTFTEGEISFPAELECGVRVAYVEPIMGDVWLAKKGPLPQWIVIGPLNHMKYPKNISIQMLRETVILLIEEAEHYDIPVYCKQRQHRFWNDIEIVPAQSWPSGFGG